MQTHSKHTYTLPIFSWFFFQSPVLSDSPKLTPHLQFDSSFMCALNINEMDSISHSWLLWHFTSPPQQRAFLSLRSLFQPHSIFSPLHSFQRVFKVITFSKRPLRMRSGNVLTLFDFWRGLSVFLIHWWHGSLHMKLQCGFQWTWGGHIYKLNLEPMGPVEKYLPSKALKWREHHLRYYIIH